MSLQDSLWSTANAWKVKFSEPKEKFADLMGQTALSFAKDQSRPITVNKTPQIMQLFFPVSKGNVN